MTTPLCEVTYMKLQPVKLWIGTEVLDIDLRHPIPEDDVIILKKAFHQSGFLLFRDQNIDEAQTRRFIRQFGKISKMGPVQRASDDGISYVSNKRPDGAFGKGELLFHSDSTHYATPPKGIMLYGVEVPSSGGATLFSNSAYVLNNVPPDFRKVLEDAEVIAEMDYGTLQFNEEKASQIEHERPTRVYSLVMDHPWSDQKILFVSQIRGRIRNRGAEESKEILDTLDRYVRNEEWMYRHHWRVGDLLMWDNFLTQHAREGFDEARSPHSAALRLGPRRRAWIGIAPAAADRQLRPAVLTHSRR